MSDSDRQIDLTRFARLNGRRGERVDKTQFAWFEKLALAKKGAAPDEMMRIKYTPTGLLDKKVLETALARITQRSLT